MIDRNGLRETFRQLTDDELRRRLSGGTLTEAAREIALEELGSRGLSFDPMLADVSDESLDSAKRTSLETIARFGTPLEAHMLKGLLEAEGIPAFVADEHLIQANWFWSNALGGVRVQVLRENVADARVIADAMGAGEYDIELPGEEMTDGEIGDDSLSTCPRCSHNAVASFTPRSRAAALAVLYFFGIPLPFCTNRLRCECCGHIWTPKVSAKRRSGLSKTSP